MGFQLKSGNKPKMAGGIVSPSCEPGLSIAIVGASPKKKLDPVDTSKNDEYMPLSEVGLSAFDKKSPLKEDDDDDSGDDNGYEPQSLGGGDEYDPQSMDDDVDDVELDDAGVADDVDAGDGTDDGADDGEPPAEDGDTTEDGAPADGEEPTEDEEQPVEEPPPGERDLSKLTGAERKAEYDARGWAHDETIEGYEAPEEVDAVGQPTMTETEKIEESVKSDSEKMEESRQEEIDEQAKIDAENQATTELGTKIAEKSVKKKIKAPMEQKLKQELKKQALKQGGKTAAKIAAKVALRAIPGVNAIMLASDAWKLGKYAFKNRDKIAGFMNRQKNNIRNKMNEWMT